jgi:hypothetical protein
MPMVLVGLKATRSTMSSPLLMPPWTPPDLRVHGSVAVAVAVGGVSKHARCLGAV